MNYLSQTPDHLRGKNQQTWNPLEFQFEPWYLIAVHFITNIAGFNDEQDAFLGTLLDGAISREGNWYRCFKAFPGWQGQHFHTACDGKGPTVTIIRVRENIFGGFLDKSWGGEYFGPNWFSYQRHFGTLIHNLIIIALLNKLEEEDMRLKSFFS